MTDQVGALAGAATALGRADGLEYRGGVPRGPRLDHRRHEQERHDNQQDRPELRHRFPPVKWLKISGLGTLPIEGSHRPQIGGGYRKDQANGRRVSRSELTPWNPRNRFAHVESAPFSS